MSEDVVICADSVRSPELRHEVPLAVPDPFLYFERGGARHIVVSSLELPRLAELDGGYVLHPFEEFGVEELKRKGMVYGEVVSEIAVRAARELGVERAAVPPGFPLDTADHLRGAGVELTVDRALFDGRRRAKSGAELDGIRRAQAAAEAAMGAAAALLRAARSAADGALELDGAPLTCERIKEAVAATVLAHGASAEEFVVSHGAQAAVGHEMGAGPLRAGETVVIDLWPRDGASACFADMTRSFVVGTPPAEVVEWHRLCAEVLERVRGLVVPGVTGRELYDAACEVFEGAGYPTQRTKADGQVLDDGFFHSLGHGVGLEVHEEPLLGIAGLDPLVAGDVIAVEPGLYRPGFGGCRLEDLLLVTADGAETLTRFRYELEP